MEYRWELVDLKVEEKENEADTCERLWMLFLLVLVPPPLSLLLSLWDEKGGGGKRHFSSSSSSSSSSCVVSRREGDARIGDKQLNAPPSVLPSASMLKGAPGIAAKRSVAKSAHFHWRFFWRARLDVSYRKRRTNKNSAKLKIEPLSSHSVFPWRVQKKKKKEKKKQGHGQARSKTAMLPLTMY